MTNYISLFTVLAAEQERLVDRYKDVTYCIPVLMEDQEGLPLGEIYAPLLIDEDLDAVKRTRRPDEPSGSRPIENIGEVFYAGNKLSRRIFIKGEAGSGKSVFCLKLMEIWSQLKQSPKPEHACEKESELLSKLRKKHILQYFLLFSKCDKYDEKSNSGDNSKGDGNLNDKYGSGGGTSDDHYFSKSALEEYFKIPCTTCDMQQCLSKIDLLYYVPLRNANSGNTSVVDLVCAAVCNCEDERERTKQMLSDKNVRCLIILDGLDEWPSSYGLPSTGGLSDKCVLLSTTRPWKLVHLKLQPQHDDRIVAVKGISSYGVGKVIENILDKFYGKKGEDLESKFWECCKNVQDKTIEDLMRMPMMLIAACHIWCDDVSWNNKIAKNEQSFSMTYLYLSLLEKMIQNADCRKSKHQNKKTKFNAVELLLKKQEEKKKKNPSVYDGLPKILQKFDRLPHLIDTLLPFCKLAFNDLVSTGTRLVFDLGDLENIGEPRVNVAQKMGLISQAKICGKSKLNEKQHVSVSFYHKSVQELLAAIQLACGAADTEKFCKYCTTIEKVMEMSNVIRFAIGVNPTVGSKLCEHVTDIVNRDTSIMDCRQTFSMNEKGDQLYKLQLTWYKEIKYSHTVTGNKSSPPSLYISDIYMRYIHYEDPERVKLTMELISSNRDSIVSAELSDNIVHIVLPDIYHPLHSMLKQLSQCPNLKALKINKRESRDEFDQYTDMLPRFTQLDTIKYDGASIDAAAIYHVADVKAIMMLTQLKHIQLNGVDLGEDGVVVTEDMPQLKTVKFWWVKMSEKSWNRFIDSLFKIQKEINVTLELTNINLYSYILSFTDNDPLRRKQKSPQFRVTRKKDVWNKFNLIEFTKLPSQGAHANTSTKL